MCTVQINVAFDFDTFILQWVNEELFFTQEPRNKQTQRLQKPSDNLNNYNYTSLEPLVS